MLKFADTELSELCARDERENDIGREALLQVCFDTECVCGVNQYTGMLRSNNRLNYCRKIVYVWQGLDAKQDIVEGALFIVRGFFWSPDDWNVLDRTDLES